MVQLSHLYMTTGKAIPLTMWTFVGKVVSLLFKTLSSFVIAFLPSSCDIRVAFKNLMVLSFIACIDKWQVQGNSL